MTRCPTTRNNWRCTGDASVPHECEARDGEPASMVVRPTLDGPLPGDSHHEPARGSKEDAGTSTRVDPLARTLPAPATLESRVAALEAAVARLIVERAC